MPQDVRKTSSEILRAIVDDIAPDGTVRIIVSGDDHPREAASLLQYSSVAGASEALLGRTVLVLVEDVSPPVILGLIREGVLENYPAQDGAEVRGRLPQEARHVQLDKRRVELEASEEIRLTCGKSSLVLRQDGSVIVRGVTIVSRASQSNKIRGATIDLN